MLLQMNMEEEEPSPEEVLKELGSFEKVCSYYQRRELARLMAHHDRISQITGAREEGFREGLVEGKLTVARNMLLENIDENLIVEITGLPLQKIQKLKEEIAGEGP